MSQEPTEARSDDLRIAFLRMSVVAAKYRCGCLVVDVDGMPVELRATEPIQPTPTQQIAYGRSLQRAVAKLCGAPLLAALEVHPTIVLVDYEEFLLLHTPDLPVVCVQAHGEELEVEPDERSERERATDGESGDTLPPPLPKWKSVRLHFAKAMSIEQRDQVRALVARIYGDHQLNVLEPFARIEKALGALDAQAE